MFNKYLVAHFCQYLYHPHCPNLHPLYNSLPRWKIMQTILKIKSFTYSLLLRDSQFKRREKTFHININDQTICISTVMDRLSQTKQLENSKNELPLSCWFSRVGAKITWKFILYFTASPLAQKIHFNLLRVPIKSE